MGTSLSITKPLTPEPIRSCSGHNSFSFPCGLGLMSNRYSPFLLLTRSMIATVPPKVPTEVPPTGKLQSGPSVKLQSNVATGRDERQIHGFHVQFYGQFGLVGLKRHNRFAFFDGFAQTRFQGFDNVAILRGMNHVLVAPDANVFVLVSEFGEFRFAFGQA